MRTKRFVLISCLLVAFGSCASVNTRAAFPDIENLVRERGIEKVHWRGDSAADAAIDVYVEKLLNGNITANQAVEIALLNNRTLQATFEELSVAQADLVAAGLLNNPLFDAQVRFFTGSANPSAELDLVQNFLDIFFIPLRKRVATAALEETKLHVAGAVLDVAGKVRAAFYEHEGAEESLGMWQQVIKASQASYTIAKNLRAAGNITELDLSSERALYEQSKLNLRSAEVSTLMTRERLNMLMGLWGKQTEWKVNDRLPDLPTKDPEPQSLEARAIERSLDLAVARQELTRAAQVLGIAQPSALFSDSAIGLSAEHERNGDWGIGPALSIPLAVFNQGQPAVARAEAAFRAANEKYFALAVTIRSQVRAAFVALSAARERANYYRKVLLPLRQQIVDQSQLQYNAMQIAPFQLVEAKQQQIDAANASIDALRRYWLARTDMDQLLNGRMTEFQNMTLSLKPDVSKTIGLEGGH